MKISVDEMIRKAPWHKKIAALRALNGWTQEEAATRCGTDKRIYWNWENGKFFPRSNSRKAIARAFGISAEEIFGSDKTA